MCAKPFNTTNIIKLDTHEAKQMLMKLTGALDADNNNPTSNNNNNNDPPSRLKAPTQAFAAPVDIKVNL